ncbi:MAG: HK97 family phage prohead protease [Methylococcales bacterium]|nr:HK97 family phage prohead protease [Methylococcales bacterium]
METFQSKLIELKLAPADSSIMEFSGYGAVFGNIDACGDVIEPGAFKQFLSDVKSGIQNWPAMLLQHGGIDLLGLASTPIGAWNHLEEDSIGLKVSGKLAPTPRGKEVYELMKMQPRPAIDGLSIGYIAREFINRTKPGDPNRRLKRIDLVEISPVVFPANDKARVQGVKSIDEVNEREFENFLCNFGYTRKAAKTIVAHGLKALQKDDGTYDLAELKGAIDTGIRQLNS